MNGFEQLLAFTSDFYPDCTSYIIPLCILDYLWAPQSNKYSYLSNFAPIANTYFLYKKSNGS